MLQETDDSLRKFSIFYRELEERITPGHTKHSQSKYWREKTSKYRVVQKKGTVLLSTSLAWPAVAGCSRAETFSRLNSIYFATLLALILLHHPVIKGPVHFLKFLPEVRLQMQW